MQRLLKGKRRNSENEDDLLIISELYKKCELRIMQIARQYVKDEGIAEDIVQKALTKISFKSEKLRDMNEYVQYAYLKKTVEREALNYLRDHKRESAVLLQEDFEETTRNIPDPSASPEEIVIRKERLQAHWDALNRLPRKERDLLFGKHFLDLSDEELADIAGCKVENVRMRLTRARHRANRFLQEGGYGHEKA